MNLQFGIKYNFDMKDFKEFREQEIKNNIGFWNAIWVDLEDKERWVIKRWNIYKNKEKTLTKAKKIKAEDKAE